MNFFIGDMIAGSKKAEFEVLMKKRLIQNNIYVKKSKTHGYGVFTSKTIRKGDVIEQCYFLISKADDKYFEDYYFDARKRRDALLLGYGSIYNHDEEPNAEYFINVTKRIATFKSLRTIKKGEEIFIHYGDEWFKDRAFKMKKQNKKSRKK